MGLPRKKRRGGRRLPVGKLARRQWATLRLDERLRYFIEIAARKRGGTISTFLEWSAEQSAKAILLGPTARSGAQLDHFWAEDEPGRFWKLATLRPDLLSYEEQRIWERVKSSPNLQDENAVRRNWIELREWARLPAPVQWF